MTDGLTRLRPFTIMKWHALFGTSASAAHPLWHHPRVTVLPHVAALTDERSAAQVVAANLRALAGGMPLAHLVDRARGY